MARPRPEAPAADRPLHRPASPERGPLSRRALFAAAAASPVLLSACGGEDEDEKEEERDAADLEIVRYLLEIEDVEAAFWREAESRGSLDSVGVDGEIVAGVARNEREHVGVLERWVQKLGGDRPRATETALDDVLAAGPQEVLSSGASLENLSAAAYLGQINRIQDRNLLASMVAIHSVEGRQAAAMNRLAGRGFSLGTGQLEGALPDGAFAEPMEMREVRIRLRRYTGGEP
ncbi:MAG TPA: ferritin-like domain-containing protein [Solirubrobacteraceae bacterium]|nr:ferritin-like domain-containing protein [Solirubrobacteraceae bacterium]